MLFTKFIPSHLEPVNLLLVSGKWKSLSRRLSGCIDIKSGTRVKVKQGTLVGNEGVLPNGKPYQYFQGIPYAVPPVGELRFQAPIPLKAFATPEIDCTKEGNVSVQRDPISGQIVGSEDCLYLNVYVPKGKTDALLPVMVFIHGGAYMYGSGNSFLYRPLYLIQEDVIVVTLNYRLGALGFLALPENGISGNMGLKDQNLALQWIVENALHFNGDPNNVTLFGESSGAVCAHLQLLSDKSKKLFHKAILQSGSANMAWGLLDKPTPRSVKLANLLGCQSDDHLEVFQYLKNYPDVADFIKYNPKLQEAEEIRRCMMIPLRPVVEDVSAGGIVTDDPLTAMGKPNSIDIPLMMGYTSAEGIQFISKSLKNLKDIDKDLTRFTPQVLNLHLSDLKTQELARDIREQYFKGCSVDEHRLNELAAAYTDMHFTIDFNFAAEVHSRKQPKSPLYFYRFDYSGGLNKYQQQYGWNHLKGVCHADELFYIFQSDLTNEPWADKDRMMVEKVCKLWTNFAKFGNPTPDKNDRFIDCTWEPVTKVTDNETFNLNAFIIDEKQRMLDNPDGNRVDFWRHVLKTYVSDEHFYSLQLKQ